MTKRMTIGELADMHQRLSDEYDELGLKQKELTEVMDRIALEAGAIMESEGQEKGSTATTDFKRGESEHLNISDFKAFSGFVKRTGRFELFQRRVGAEAYRELRDARVKVPGVTVFNKPYFRTSRRKPRA